MKVAPSSSAVASLKALQAKVFGTTYNPTHARTGAKVLRQRLQGPSMLSYYPSTVNFKSIQKLAPGLGRLQDARETQRLKDVERKKMLGKGPPKKGKYAPPSRSLLHPHRAFGRLCTVNRAQVVAVWDRIGSLTFCFVLNPFARYIHDIRRGTTRGDEGQEKVNRFSLCHTKRLFLFGIAFAPVTSPRFHPTHCTFSLSVLNLHDARDPPRLLRLRMPYASYTVQLRAKAIRRRDHGLL